MAIPSKYNAIWLSHSSINTFLKCPRAYYLSSVYKDPKSKRKVHQQTTYMSLGTAVHNVLEKLSTYPAAERLKRDLLADFVNEWEQFKGEKGAFIDQEQENEFYKRGVQMIQNVIDSPSIFARKTIPLKSYYDGNMIPNIMIDEKNNLILCGSIDWIEYLEETKTLRVIDLKTGKNDESDESMQLPIYKILLEKLQTKWLVSDGAYYYLDRNELIMKDLSLADSIIPKIISVGLDIKSRRYDEQYEPRKDMQAHFTCTKGGCRDCEPYEKIINGEAKFVGVSGYDQDSYVVE